MKNKNYFKKAYLYLFLSFLTCLITKAQTGTVSDPIDDMGKAHHFSSGRYYFDIGGNQFQAEIDNSEGGGWILILQYVHQGGTNPNLNVISNSSDLPVLSTTALGGDDSGDLTKWGHAGNALLSTLSGTDELRFYGQTSGHNRTVHFKTTLGLSYVKTGTGSFDGLNTNFTALGGHTANMPGVALNAFFSDEQDLALTEYAFARFGSEHWAIKAFGHRWEVDDVPSNFNNSTIHRVWIRASQPVDLNPGTDISIQNTELGLFGEAFIGSSNAVPSAGGFGHKNSMLSINADNSLNPAITQAPNGFVGITSDGNGATNKQVWVSAGNSTNVKFKEDRTRFTKDLYFEESSVMHSPEIKNPTIRGDEVEINIAENGNGGSSENNVTFSPSETTFNKQTIFEEKVDFKKGLNFIGSDARIFGAKINGDLTFYSTTFAPEQNSYAGKFGNLEKSAFFQVPTGPGVGVSGEERAFDVYNTYAQPILRVLQKTSLPENQDAYDANYDRENFVEINAILDVNSYLHVGKSNHTQKFDYDSKTDVIQDAVAHFDGRVYVSEEDSRYTDDNDAEKGLDTSHPAYEDHLLWVEKGITTTNVAYVKVPYWHDYVFNEDYKLNTIDQLQSYIKENGHLPTMPSEEYIIENGFDALDMTGRLVKTVEELTLHTISQEEALEAQNKEIDGLKEAMKEQKKLTERLLKRLEALEKNLNN